MEIVKKIKGLITIENLIYIYIILNPILDIVSFLTRNIWETTLSPTTILRPIIPTLIMIYIFIKGTIKFKVRTIIISAIYLVYTIIHIYLFTKNITGSSYGGISLELRYMINYTFMIMNLFIFNHVFKNKINISKLQKSLIISMIIYIGSMYISIITNTSSFTYPYEQIGYKGWFESGNSVSAIIILSMFGYISYIKNKEQKKYIKIILPLIILSGIYLVVLVGTRTGLLGFLIVIISYIFAQIAITLIKKVKINKKIIIISVLTLLIIICGLVIFGSSTLERREYIESQETESNLTGDLTNILAQINNNTLEEEFMNEAQKQSIIDLGETAKILNVDNTDQRMQQLIYNVHLVGNQSNIALMIFGNGYSLNFRELIMEMEIMAILLNFGIIGFILYLGPFIYILFKSIVKGVKNIKKIDDEYILLILSIGFAFALSLLTGYVFFNISTVTVIIILLTILSNKSNNLEKEIEIQESK